MQEHFDAAALERCLACGGCRQNCPIYLKFENYRPEEVIRDILSGDAEQHLASEQAWQCAECHTCTEMCPQVYSWETVMRGIKSEAMRRGLAPEQVKRGIEMWRKTGKLGEPKLPARKKLGLPEPARSGLEDLKKLAELLRKNEQEPTEE